MYSKEIIITKRNFNFRFRIAELSFTLQGLSSLISALKKIPVNKG